VGSTALSTQLDPEDLRAIFNAYHRCCTELAERNGGFVAKYMGDGVLAYFGYPRASEYDAERAVRAGLALVEAVPKLATTIGTPLQIRVGIATGLVVVGDLIGTGAAQEQAVVGETPNLAARLQALAEPGSVVISASTRRLIGGLFEYRDLGTVRLKGFAENVPAWQVTGLGAAESRFEALRTASTPLVGRDEEIDLLMRRWEQAKAGDGQVVLISGEPGIGKSRIVQALMERISGEPHTRLRYFCSPHHQDSAFYPSIAQLERAAAFRREDTPTERLMKLESVLGQGTDDLAEAVPLLADLLSIPTGDRYQPLNLTPQQRKQNILKVQLAQVEGLAARNPVLMVWEDIHWSDPTTREALDMLIERVPSLRILAILTFRPDFTSSWVGLPQVYLLAVSRLSTRTRAEMIRHLATDNGFPEELIEQIAERTDGVPLFIEELTKSILESGVVAETGEYHQTGGSWASVAIPTTLHASLLSRLDRLAPIREIAQIGAALGRSFSHELICAVAQIPSEQVHDALVQLMYAELIYRRGNPPDADYTFKHALIQDAAYSTLLRARRQQIHARIADTLERAFPEIVATQPHVLAHHCAHAGMADRAVRYCLRAAKQAIARSAMAEAVSQLQKGLAVLPDMPETRVRQEHELELLIAKGQALFSTKGYAAQEPAAAFGRAYQLCIELGQPPQMGRVLVGHFVSSSASGELRRSMDYAQEIREFGAARGDPMWECVGGIAAGNSAYYLGEFTDSRAYFAKSLAVWDPVFRESGMTPDDYYVSGTSHLALTLCCLGYPDQARRALEDAISEAKRLNAHTLAFALYQSMVLSYLSNGNSLCQIMSDTAQQLADISQKHGFKVWSASAKFMKAWCLALDGKVLEGITLADQATTELAVTGSKLMSSSQIARRCLLCKMAGTPDEGLRRLAPAMPTESTEERWAEAEIYRVSGELLVAIGNVIGAENSFAGAIAVARRQASKHWELRAATSLARLWRDQGKRTEAHDLLAPVYGWFTEGFDMPVLKEAKGLLDELTINDPLA
jgi:class 3 adenylate cyclase/predicted ATPase